MKNNEVLNITETAILSALAVVLLLISTFVPILQMPQGGSVTLSMLPIIVLALRRGVKYGLIGGLILGGLNLITDISVGQGTFVFHWGSFFLDYLLACAVLGFAGFFKNKREQTGYLILAVALAGFLKYLLHSLSGVIIFGAFAEGLGYVSLLQKIFYSFILYNLPYMLASTILSILVALAAKRVLFKEYSH